MVLYAFLAAVGIRFIDEPLKAQPDNPYLIAVLVAAFPHLMNWTRGSMGVMTVEVAECVAFAMVLGICGRFVWGVQKPAQHQLASGYRLPSHASGAH